MLAAEQIWQSGNHQTFVQRWVIFHIREVGFPRNQKKNASKNNKVPAAWAAWPNFTLCKQLHKGCEVSSHIIVTQSLF